MDGLLYKLRSGKKLKFVYYGMNILRMLLPNGFYRARLERVVSRVARRPDKAYIEERVNYYNKLCSPTRLPLRAMTLKEHRLPEHGKVYFFDTRQYTRWFSPSFRWGYCPGDVTFVPDHPSVVKSRPLTDDNMNSILMKLDKIRHFIFVHDTIPFTRKKNMAIFRGKVRGKSSRQQFMEMYFGHPLFDVGNVSRSRANDLQPWQTMKKTIRQHLEYKFVMALEGNDVASNLKWVMSSNSIAVMPRPTCETWFMEGTLKPNYHYIEIQPDFSNLEERLNYYIEHVDEAQRIIEHAHEFVAPFKDKEREKLISLLVLDKYFKMTGQKLN